MFNGFLRQSTASQTLSVGPFLDDTDFKTTENGLTIANTDIKLKKNGATAVNKNSGGATADVNGKYAITLDATDTNTVGELDYSIDVAGALIVTGKFMVIQEAIYDLYYAAAATGLVTLAAVTHTGAVIPTVTDITGNLSGSVGSVTGSVGSVTGNVGGNVVGTVASVVGNVAGNVTGSIGSLGTTAKSNVNTEVLDVMGVDTHVELTGVPTFPASITTMIRRSYATQINPITSTAADLTFFNSSSVAQWKKAQSDDTITYTQGVAASP